MTWILLLIQALPSIVNLIVAIMQAIEQRPFKERAAFRRRANAIAKAHFVKRRGVTYMAPEAVTTEELQKLHEEITGFSQGQVA